MVLYWGLRLVYLKDSFYCEWFIQLSDYRLSDYKLSDYMIESQLQSTPALWTPRYYGHPAVTDNS